MSIIKDTIQSREIYAEAAGRGWVLPCICTENLTTTESIFAAAAQYGEERGMKDVPVILAITCNYDHRSQAVNYTHSRRWDTGLSLFKKDAEILAGKGGPYERLRVMLHLDHIQYDTDKTLLDGDLSDYASILYDASALPLEENIRLTADFVSRRGKEILVEGACDEIMDATGSVHNDVTTPEKAKRYADTTGVDFVVANLGTEHRASGKELRYHGDAARAIKAEIGSKIVLHGTSSVTSDQVKGLYADGVCKVNIWTALERDSSPALLSNMVKNAQNVAGGACVDKLIAEGYLTEKCRTEQNAALSYFTTLYRQSIVYEEMKRMVKAYFDLWYV
ncbi:MAG: class II fructose-bisphosphate aldolase [Eubacteriales bacterium]